MLTEPNSDKEKARIKAEVAAITTEAESKPPFHERRFVGRVVNEGQPAEAIVLKAKLAFGDGLIVLCFIPNRREFVTWWTTNECENTCNGRYMLDVADALRDFEERS